MNLTKPVNRKYMLRSKNQDCLHCDIHFMKNKHIFLPNSQIFFLTILKKKIYIYIFLITQKKLHSNALLNFDNITFGNKFFLTSKKSIQYNNYHNVNALYK